MSIEIKLWGNNIWYLFHTIAHKIKESEFINEKNNLIVLIKTICHNLPCPECSSDATQILNNTNFRTINTKDDFKMFLFNFHNHVNKKLKKPVFEHTELDNKYSKANIYNLYKNFNHIFSSNSNIPQLMMSSFHRQHNLPKIQYILNRLLSKYE